MTNVEVLQTNWHALFISRIGVEGHSFRDCVTHTHEHTYHVEIDNFRGQGIHDSLNIYLKNKAIYL